MSPVISRPHPIKSFFLSLLQIGSTPKQTTTRPLQPVPPVQHDSLTRDAFNIADQSMIGILRAACICQDADGTRLWPVDTNGMKVKTVAEACPQILRALAWCRQRDMADIEVNPWDELIVLKAAGA